MKFLQGQTTTDFREVEQGCVLPGAVCSLKGRVLFSFIAVPEGENVTLLLPVDQLEAALAHLKKYAVFSKTRLEDASSSYAIFGVAGPEADRVVEQLGLQPPAAHAVSRRADGAWAVRVFNENRCLVALPVAGLASAWATLKNHAIAAEDSWWAADIRSGFATIFSTERDRFQPQELNYHALRAVSYNKGCYTGQEVVARLYFRGKLKQRLYALEILASSPVPETGIFSADTRVGDVVMSAKEANGRQVLLAIVKNSAAREGKLALGEHGPSLRVIDLPYELPADKEE
jgi:folate-binding protein YgfZ